MKQPPIHVIRIGTIKAAIWKNESTNGAFHTVSFERLYKDSATWNHSGHFGRDDLLILAQIADAAHSWICSQSTGAIESTLLGRK